MSWGDNNTGNYRLCGKLKETGLYVQGTEDPEVEYIKIVK